MSASLLDLIAQARTAGVVVDRGRDGALVLRAPSGAAAYAMTLRERAADVLRLYDWHAAPLGDPQPCRLCGGLALLRDPVTRQPCHKVCVDALLSGHRIARARPARRCRATR